MALKRAFLKMYQSQQIHFLDGDFFGFGDLAFLGLLFAEAFGFFTLAGDFLAVLGLPTLALDTFSGLGVFFELAALASFCVAFLACCSEEPEMGNLKEPAAPLPVVRINVPLSTEVVKYFLMKGVIFSASILYVSVTYFLMACKEDPSRSFRLWMALVTMLDVGGWPVIWAFLVVAFGFAGVVFFSAETASISAESIIIRASFGSSPERGTTREFEHVKTS